MRWCIYYGDGSAVSDSEHSAFEVPVATGVQVIAVESYADPKGYFLVHSKDYYTWREGRWIGCDLGGLYDYLMLLPGAKRVLFGRTMARDDEFFAIQSRASREGLG